MGHPDEVVPSNQLAPGSRHTKSSLDSVDDAIDIENQPQTTFPSSALVLRVGLATTSSPTSSPPFPPRALAQDGPRPKRSASQTPSSPALSTTSTADGEAFSPSIPHLTAPPLPKRALELLRTPPRDDTPEDSQYVTASWGSPYPKSEEDNLRRQSPDSGGSDNSSIHRLEFDTPFLRPAPYLAVTPAEQQPTSLATILVNRARRPEFARGLTEDWIRQHTATDEHAEPRHWLSDGSDSEHSSLSGSPPGDGAAWLEDKDLKTPRANPGGNALEQTLSQHPRARSSTETLKQSTVDFTQQTQQHAEMATSAADGPEPRNTDEAMVSTSAADARPKTPSSRSASRSASKSRVAGHLRRPSRDPVTPPRTELKKENAPTPRTKKRVPWRGKNIMVLLPRDEGRGRHGNRPIPLKEHEVRNMFREWEQLGYDIRGFDLNEPTAYSALPIEHYSRSRDEWPDVEETKQEWTERKFPVALPDIQAWKTYVDELNEAKLRALGVSFADDEPPLPPPVSISPNPHQLSRRATITQYPPLPFSPPIPPSSASSQGLAQFPFPGQPTSGSITAVASPTPFGNNFNPQHPAAMSPNQPPFGFLPPQSQPSPRDILLSQQGMHRASPSLSVSPFAQSRFPSPLPHQRHQSLQFPQLPYQQFIPPARSTPHLQELREEEEEEQHINDPPEIPEPTASLVRHNASNSLQREINEAEYHLEEQFRSQLEHDQDYSPYNKEDVYRGAQPELELPSAPQFKNAINDDLVLHHPRPHSRGHSLSQKYFDEDDIKISTETGDFGNLSTIQDDKASEELETNPSNLGTPVHVNFPESTTHDRTFSNPWRDVQSISRRPSHDSKPSNSSKFNGAAPEFKFNPTSSFQPGQFSFGNNTFQPAAFENVFASAAPESVHLDQFSPPAAPASKINVNAPVFSPGSSDFNFTAAGAPAFNPDAPSFTPLQSFNGSVSVASPLLSGSDSGTMPMSIFGHIDLNMPLEIVRPAKASKAVPIRRPSNQTSSNSLRRPTLTEDESERPTNDLRAKRIRSTSISKEDDVRFDEPEEHATPTHHVANDESATQVVDEVEARLGPETTATTTIPTSVVYKPMDAQDETSSPEASPAERNAMNWAPVELKSEEISDFNAARAFGEDTFMATHDEGLSATVAPSVPSTYAVNDSSDKENTPVPAVFGEALPESDEHAVLQPVEEQALTGVVVQRSIETEASPMISQSGNDTASDQARFVPSPSPANKGLRGSRFAESVSPVDDLRNSKYDRSPSAISDNEAREPQETMVSFITADDLEDTQETVSGPASPPAIQFGDGQEIHEPTFEEIDEVMRHINEDPAMGVKKTVESTLWQPSPTRPIPIPGAVASTDSPKHIHPHFRDKAHSPSPRQYHLPIGVQAPLLSTELEDPFLDPPVSVQLSRLDSTESPAPSDDWEGAFSDEEQNKLDSRAAFFDGRVNNLVDGVLEARLGPLEKTLEGIQRALTVFSNRTQSRRRDPRSVSIEKFQESDADDEDDEPITRRSMSPRKDRRMDQIRAAVMEGIAVQQRNNALQSLPSSTGLDEVSTQTLMSIMRRTVEEMKQQVDESLLSEYRTHGLRAAIEEALENRLPPPEPAPLADAEGDRQDLIDKVNELFARNNELEQRLRFEEDKKSAEVGMRRAAEDRAAEFERQLHMAETRIEVEIINRSAYDQRVGDLEDKLGHQESVTESELSLRRAAEDRLAEMERLFRNSSEEEVRLRDTVEEKDERVKILDAHNSKNQMRIALLETSVEAVQKDKADLEARVEVAEAEARDFHQEANRWRIEAERAIELSERQSDDLHHALQEKKQLSVLVDTLGTQLNENERVRESWRSKFLSLQDDMGRVTFEIGEENARRAKQEQVMLARQEVLDAKLQAESRTRERLEVELERLEAGERQGMKAVNEAKRLEAILGNMKNENHKLQQTAMRFQNEFVEARESGAREVQRTRESMQGQIEAANHQVNMVREELEDQISRLHAQLDHAKLDADTVRSRFDMLVEDARQSSKGDVEALTEKHRDEMEDMQARFERRLSNAMEDAQRAESNLLERLSISTSRCEHLQDRVSHLEEKLEITREAARAAAQAAKASGFISPAGSTPVPGVRSATVAQPLAPPEAAAGTSHQPEKISPQALRESIMVLQEQLQEREQKIESLEQTVSKLDPEAGTKIAKRDDEIVWLRELLAVRHSDLQDIITALGRSDYDQERVRDAAIRLKANLQMEQQERERAMNGGSNINLPNIAASLRERAPGVVQAVGPLAAALGNWRKGGSFSTAKTSSGADANTFTPQKDGAPSQSSFLTGLLTPPQSNLRQASGPGQQQPQVTQQPTAFSATGRRFTAQDLANRPKPPPSMSQRQASKAPARESSPLRQPSEPSLPQTPPMMRLASYDDDALAQDEFDDAGFFDDE